MRESGAVAAQFHDPAAIEPYSSDLVGASAAIVLGKKSGIDSIRIAAERLGLDLSPERQAELLVAVKRLGTEQRGLVTDEQLLALVQDGRCRQASPSSSSSDASESDRLGRSRASSGRRASSGARSCSSMPDRPGWRRCRGRITRRCAW